MATCEYDPSCCTVSRLQHLPKKSSTHFIYTAGAAISSTHFLRPEAGKPISSLVETYQRASLGQWQVNISRKPQPPPILSHTG